MGIRPPVRPAAGMLAFACGLSALAGLSCRVSAGSQPDGANLTAYTAGAGGVHVGQGQQDYLRFGLAAWGPSWAWTGVDGGTHSEDGAATAALTGKMGGTGVPFTLAFQAARILPRQLTLSYDLRSQADTDTTLLAVTLEPGPAFAGRDVAVVAATGEGKTGCPFGRGTVGTAVRELRLSDGQGRPAVIRFDPACDIESDGAARIVLARGRMTAGAAHRLRITVELPAEVDWYPTAAEVPDEPGIADWYPWQATSDTGPNLIGLDDWLEKPAGKHGRIVRRADALICDGQPIKLWGVNLSFGACAPEKALADRRAAFYRKYGINAVRLHKYADGPGWAGIQSPQSAVEFDPQALDRMDYQVAALKKAGVYVLLSAHFGAMQLGPADRKLVPFLDEFGAMQSSRVGTPHSAIFYSPELQQAHILQSVSLLKHRNPYTGLTYAEDPAVAFVEIINEQSVLFYTSSAPLKASPTIRREACARFCEWLRRRYGTQQRLVAAWGKDSFDCLTGEGFPAVGESLDKGNILPFGNPWYWDPDQLNGSQKARKQRLLDTLEFLTSVQDEFYARYVKAIRAAGYQGEMIASNWQAGRAFSHYANLHSDALVGTIDRHNYFGDQAANATMLSKPGSGLLSTGMQQVADRSFMISEWAHVFPNEMGAEGPAILGAYGMGLQGWDASFYFQNGDDGRFSDRMGRQTWDAVTPNVLGLFPAVAREIHRGDVKQAAGAATRSVHFPSLFQGRLSFDDRVTQGYDAKELDSSTVPGGALAAVRSVVAFAPEYRETRPFDLRPYVRGGAIVSSTGQLRWVPAAGASRGYFTVDTPATAAVVGFAQGVTCRLGGATIKPDTQFAAIYVTARDVKGTLASSRDIVVVAMARARNTGMKLSPAGDRMLVPGKAPIVMEPVKATLMLARQGKATVTLLDHDGKPTGRTRPLTGVRLEIDGARDRTPYYLIRYE